MNATQAASKVRQTIKKTGMNPKGMVRLVRSDYTKRNSNPSGSPILFLVSPRFIGKFWALVTDIREFFPFFHAFVFHPSKSEIYA